MPAKTKAVKRRESNEEFLAASRLRAQGEPPTGSGACTAALAQELFGLLDISGEVSRGVVHQALARAYDLGWAARAKAAT